MPDTRYVTEEPARNPEERFRLYRLCDCPTCEGSGKELISASWNPDLVVPHGRCPDCRGEGRIRQEIASCETPEAVGVAIVTLAREGEWEGCPLGLLDTLPECEECDGKGRLWIAHSCAACLGSGVKPTGTWLILPWLPSARNVSDAGRTLARSKRK